MGFHTYQVFQPMLLDRFFASSRRSRSYAAPACRESDIIVTVSIVRCESEFESHRNV